MHIEDIYDGYRLTSIFPLFSYFYFIYPFQAVSKVPPRTNNATPPNRMTVGTTGAVKKNDSAGAQSNHQIEELSSQVRPQVEVVSINSIHFCLFVHIAFQRLWICV